MTVKILKILLMIFVILSFEACSCKPIIKYVDKPYEVKVPVKCLVPDANCTFNYPSDTEVINAMRRCIIDMKHNSEICQ